MLNGVSSSSVRGSSLSAQWIRNSNSSRRLEWLLAGSLHCTACKGFPILLVPAGSFCSRLFGFVLDVDVQKVFRMERAPSFCLDVVVDDERVFRSWNIRLVETVFVSGECADGVADAAVLFGVAEADISVMHLPDEGAYPVGGDECVVPVHTIVLPDGGCLFHEPHPLKRMLFFNLGHCSSVYFDYVAKVGNGKGKDCPSLTHK